MKRLSSLENHGNDYVVILLTALLTTFGLAMLASASSNLSQLNTGDSLYYLKHQMISGLAIGLLGFILASNIHYKRYERLSALGMAFGIVLLMLTFTPLAVEMKGAARWVKAGPVTFQPSEPLKLFFIIYLAAWLASTRGKGRHTAKSFAAFLAILAIVMGLLLKQPATSASMLVGTIAVIMYFASGARLSYLPVIMGLIAGGFAIAVFLAPYRLARIEAFFHPDRNAQTSGWQVNQAKNAIGSGGLTGVGYGQSLTKLHSLPEPLGDSIFAVVGEELGFVGSMTLVGLLLALVLRILFIAHRARDQFGHLLLIGFASLIGIQSFVNVAAISGLMPLTGMSLPFISYGSTALTVFLTIMGIVNNISKHTA